MTEAEKSALIARHTAVFERPLIERIRAGLIFAGVSLYLVFAWWLFGIGQVLSDGRWDIASAYLADWVSYEVRPDVDFRGPALEVSFPRFSPLGENPDPDWLVTQKAMVESGTEAQTDLAGTASGSTSNAGFLGALSTAPAPAPASSGEEGFLGSLSGSAASSSSAGTTEAAAAAAVRREAVVAADVSFGGDTSVSIVPGLVTVTHAGETLLLDIVENKSVIARGDLPEWASQRAPGAKVIARFGFAGRAEIEDDEVKLRRRFLGWENFVFDTRSPFWGLPASQVIGLVVWGERIQPERSNFALAFDNVWNNADWQHGDVWTKLLQTIVMAFAGTVLASMLAFPLAFAAARNITPNRFVNQLMKRFFDFLRSVDMLIWALFFTRAFGPGPLAGISAIFFTDTGTFGKLYGEALENIDDKQREGVRSVGAAPASVQRYGVVPQVLPVFLSQSLYFWESNTRSATIIGAVGAGGIGLKLWEAMRTNQDWENVAYMVILILLVVFVFDAISSALRYRLIGMR